MSPNTERSLVERRIGPILGISSPHSYQGVTIKKSTRIYLEMEDEEIIEVGRHLMMGSRKNAIDIHLGH
jgi:hypothetical protein